MSKSRNTPVVPRRGRHIVLSAAALAGTLAASLVTACSSDAHDPTAPAASRNGEVNGPTKYFGTAAAQAYATAAINAWDAQQMYNWSQFLTMLSTWHTSAGDHQAGTRIPEVMTCGAATTTTASVAVPIAPSASAKTFQVGRGATVTIPAGAVTSATTITATATTGAAGVVLDFQPHGYTFAKAIRIDVNYQGCGLRYTSPLNFFYMNDTGGIIQTMPSNDDRTNNTIHALTDHFSHYMVAWS